MKSVRATELLEELDASNCVGRGIHSEQVVQVGDALDVSQAILLEVQVLKVLVLLQLVAKIFHGRVSLLHSQSSEGVRATIYMPSRS